MSHSSALPVLIDAEVPACAGTPLTSDPAPEPIDERSRFTRPRQVAFLAALAATGSVRSASACVGVSHQTAYRARLASPGFRRGWDAALLAARAQAEEVLACRALEGWEEDVVYHGEVVCTRRRFSDRLLLAHLGRLDRLCGDAEVAQFADEFDTTLARYEAGEDRPARPPEPAPQQVSAPERGPAGISSPGQWSMRSTDGEGARIPPPLPVQVDPYGQAESEAQALSLGMFGVWWHVGAGCHVTNWPAPADWQGTEYLLEGADEALVPLAERTMAAERLAGLDDEDRAAAGWVRTLSAAEEAGLDAADAAPPEDLAAARAARRALYARAAFGLASPAELAALDAANPDRDGSWLAEVGELAEAAG